MKVVINVWEENKFVWIITKHFNYKSYEQNRLLIKFTKDQRENEKETKTKPRIIYHNLIFFKLNMQISYLK